MKARVAGDPHGDVHDIVVLAHPVDEQWSGTLTAGIDEAWADPTASAY